MSLMDKLKSLLGGGSSATDDSHAGHDHAAHAEPAPPTPPVDPAGTMTSEPQPSEPQPGEEENRLA
jgi:hypothetical protein